MGGSGHIVKYTRTSLNHVGHEMVIWICQCGKRPWADLQASFVKMLHSSRQHVSQHCAKQTYYSSRRIGWKKNALVAGGWHVRLRMGCILLLLTAMVSNAAFSSAVVVASLIRMDLFRTTSTVVRVLSTAK